MYAVLPRPLRSPVGAILLCDPRPSAARALTSHPGFASMGGALLAPGSQSQTNFLGSVSIVSVVPISMVIMKR